MHVCMSLVISVSDWRQCESLDSTKTFSQPRSVSTSPCKVLDTVSSRTTFQSPRNSHAAGSIKEMEGWPSILSSPFPSNQLRVQVLVGE